MEAMSKGAVFEYIGDEVFAPLLGAYAWWLHEQAKRDGVTRLLFLARDGYMMQRAYQAVIPPEEQIPSRYMYASRRLFNLAAIRQLDETALHFLLGDHVEMPVGKYLERAGLNPRNFAAKLLETGFTDGPATVVTDALQPNLRRFFGLIEREVLAVAETERRLLKAYADSVADWDIEVCGVIDIGWHGSLQTSLRDVLGLEPSLLKGYYLGLHHGASHSEPDTRRAFLDESRPGDFIAYHRSLRRCVEIFELFFAETDGSIIGLNQDKSGAFRPVREIGGQTKETLADLASAQAAVMRRLERDGAPTDRAGAIRAISRLLSHPRPEEARYLGDIVHQEGFGGFGRQVRLARPRYTWKEYVHHLGELVWDVRKTFWRAGFIARLSHNSPFNDGPQSRS
jgi:hypothetical protein